LSTFPDSAQRSFDKFCACTAVGTLLWNMCLDAGWVQHISSDYNMRQSSVSEDTINFITKIYLDRLEQECEKNKIAFIQTIIPDSDGKKLDTGTLNYLFNGSYELPVNLDPETDYFKKGIHFNNQGALKCANFLDSVLKPLASIKLKQGN
jgi:hypothetical protein